MGNDVGGDSSSAGQVCPAQGGPFGKGDDGEGFCENGAGADFGDVTAEERAIIGQFLNGPKVPGAQGGRALRLALSALKFAAVLLVGAGVVQGYGDGDEFDEVGCTVAHQPDGVSHGGHTKRPRKGTDGEKPDSINGGSGGGGADGAPECEVATGVSGQMGDGRACRIGREEHGCEMGNAAVTELLAGIHREIAAVRQDFGELRTAKQGLEKMLAAGMSVLTRKVDGVLATGAGRVEPDVPVSEREAQRVFQLMRRLEGGPRQSKAPLGVVFRLTVLEGHTQAKAARLCGCVPALISRRVKTIESRFGMSIEQLRNFASVVLEMEASVKGDKRRTWKDGAAGDEAAGCGEDDDG